LERPSSLGDQREVCAEGVDFELSRPRLEGALDSAAGPDGGRPPFDPAMVLKILVIQALSNHSEKRTEFDNDRPSFMRFLGLSLSDRVPDATTIWLFRERLVKAGARSTYCSTGSTRRYATRATSQCPVKSPTPRWSWHHREGLWGPAPHIRAAQHREREGGSQGRPHRRGLGEEVRHAPAEGP
jgi:hypothetical protein